MDLYCHARPLRFDTAGKKSYGGVHTLRCAVCHDYSLPQAGWRHGLLEDMLAIHYAEQTMQHQHKDMTLSTQARLGLDSRNNTL